MTSLWPHTHTHWPTKNVHEIGCYLSFASCVHGLNLVATLQDFPYKVHAILVYSLISRLSCGEHGYVSMVSLAKVMHLFNLKFLIVLQISCHSSSPTLRNRERFRHYYQVNNTHTLYPGCLVPKRSCERSYISNTTIM